ncbi:MAG: J domain-containing protein [Marmoricola sp.]
MSQTHEVTHYDVLGVAPTAKPEAIRKAWRRRTGKAGPGSPELARLNEAAEVLLDPYQRRQYDATLPPEPAAVPAEDETGPRAARGWRTWAGLGALTAVTVAAVVVAVLLSLQHRTDEATDTARQEASAAVERALPQVLSYDYRNLDEARAQADRYLTPGFRSEVDRNFRLLQKNPDGTPGAAVQTKTVVKATVLGTAAMQASPDAVQVLAYVDQRRTGDQGTSIFQNRVAVSMVHRGDAWLVDGLDPR